MKDIMVVPWQHRDNTMRIAFAGSAGIGKTTLLKSVNEYLQYPVVSEGVRSYIEEHKITDFHKLNDKQLMKFQLEILNRKRAVEPTYDRFIADRTSLDNMAYALYYLSNKEEYQRGLMDYATDCTIHAVQTYDVIFVLPYGMFPIEDDGIRKPMPAHQLMIHMLIEHAVALGQGQSFHVHQVQEDTVENRTMEVLNVVDRMLDTKQKFKAERTGMPIPESEMVN